MSGDEKAGNRAPGIAMFVTIVVIAIAIIEFTDWGPVPRIAVSVLGGLVVAFLVSAVTRRRRT